MADGTARWDIPPSWQPALEAARAGGTIIVLGGVDSGKSTLAAVLAQEARRAGRTVAVVDADIGQSSIGPPACVGMARVTSDVGSLDDLHPEAIDFVGACSPLGHLLQCAASVAAMAKAAANGGAGTLIVDTTGLVSGPSARALKGANVRILDPDVLIAIERDDEVEHLVAHYRVRARPTVIRLLPSRSVKQRSREERAARRQRKFAACLAEAKTIEVSWDDAPAENGPWTSGDPVPGHVRAYAEERLACEVLYAARRGDGISLVVSGRADPAGLRALGEGFGGNASAVDVSALQHLLVGVLGDSGQTLALGILEETDFRRRRSSIFTPLDDPSAARGLRLGSIRIARDGTQLGSNDRGAAG
ncbi:MAG: hypothetical protein MUQ26_07005 [Armatimonadetes bacterium]|nr:hypothetical protein [Armatimonadota bacterium]